MLRGFIAQRPVDRRVMRGGMLLNGVDEFLAPLLPPTMNVSGKECVGMPPDVLSLKYLPKHVEVLCIPSPQRSPSDGDLVVWSRQLSVILIDQAQETICAAD